MVAIRARIADTIQRATEIVPMLDAYGARCASIRNNNKHEYQTRRQLVLNTSEHKREQNTTTTAARQIHVKRHTRTRHIIGTVVDAIINGVDIIIVIALTFVAVDAMTMLMLIIRNMAWRIFALFCTLLNIAPAAPAATKTTTQQYDATVQHCTAQAGAQAQGPIKP